MPRKKKARPNCKNCGETCPRLTSTYCDTACHNNHKYKTYIDGWLKEEEKGYGDSVSLDVSAHIRRYLFEQSNSSCSKCGWSEINPYTNRFPLQINHIDGDAENCSKDNLELLCPSCHSLTSNFGSRNIGNNKRRHR